MNCLSIIYQLQQTEVSEAITNDPDLEDDFWDDQPKQLPSGVILLVNEIKKALMGEDFFYFESIDVERTFVKGIGKDVWSYYFSVFHHSEEFGLPHGGGWMMELPGTIQLLTQLKYIKRLIQADSLQKANKGQGQRVVNPRRFEG